MRIALRLFILLIILMGVSGTSHAQSGEVCYNARLTAGFVTDPSCGVPFLGETYPHTYGPNTLGNSMVAGVETDIVNCLNGISGNARNRKATNDPRLAGVAFVLNTATNHQCTLRFDISSGIWTLDGAFGDTGVGAAPSIVSFIFKDNGVPFLILNSTTLGWYQAILPQPSNKAAATTDGIYMDLNGQAWQELNWVSASASGKTQLVHNFTGGSCAGSITGGCLEITMGGPQIVDGVNQANMSYSAFSHLHLTPGGNLAPVITSDSFPPAVNAGQTHNFTSTCPSPPCSWTRGATSTGSINSTTGVYTAPAVVKTKLSYGGCQLVPNDSIWVSRVDSLGVHPNQGTTATITNTVEDAAGTATITTSAAHGYVTGQRAATKGTTNGGVGKFDFSNLTITSTPTTTTYTVLLNNNNGIAIPSAADSGSTCNGYCAALGATRNLLYLPLTALNKINNSTPTQSITFNSAKTPLLDTQVSGFQFPLPQLPIGYRNGGWFNNNGGIDHNLGTVNTDTCTFQEFYQLPTTGPYNTGIGAGTQVPGDSYALGTPFTIEAAAIFFLPLQIHAQELRYAVATSGDINHIGQMSIFNPSICNCYDWPAVSFAPEVPNQIPYGTVFRLKASFDISTFTPRQQIILRQWQRYGFMTTDGTVANYDAAISAEDHWTEDEMDDFGVVAAVAKSPGFVLEAVDLTGLKGEGDTSSATINTERVIVTGANGAKASMKVILHGVTVDIETTNQAIVDKSPAHQFLAFVHGASDLSVTWSMSPTIPGTFVGGAYTPPGNLTTTQYTTITATSNADPTVFASFTLEVLPAAPIRLIYGQASRVLASLATVTGGNTANITVFQTDRSGLKVPRYWAIGQSINIDGCTGAALVLNGGPYIITNVSGAIVSFAKSTGNFSLSLPGCYVTNPYIDTQGNPWVTAGESVVSRFDNGGPVYGSNSDKALYQVNSGTLGNGDTLIPLILPNGYYQATIKLQANSGNLLDHEHMSITTNGIMQFNNFDLFRTTAISSAISNTQLVSNVGTITTSSPHGCTTGMSGQVTGTTNGGGFLNAGKYNGITVVDSTHVTMTYSTHADIPPSSDTGILWCGSRIPKDYQTGVVQVTNNLLVIGLYVADGTTSQVETGYIAALEIDPVSGISATAPQILTRTECLEKGAPCLYQDSQR